MIILVPQNSKMFLFLGHFSSIYAGFTSLGWNGNLEIKQKITRYFLNVARAANGIRFRRRQQFHLWVHNQVGAGTKPRRRPLFHPVTSQDVTSHCPMASSLVVTSRSGMMAVHLAGIACNMAAAAFPVQDTQSLFLQENDCWPLVPWGTPHQRDLPPALFLTCVPSDTSCQKKKNRILVLELFCGPVHTRSKRGHGDPIAATAVSTLRQFKHQT